MDLLTWDAQLTSADGAVSLRAPLIEKKHPKMQTWLTYSQTSQGYTKPFC